MGRRRSGVLGLPRYGDLLRSAGGVLPRPGERGLSVDLLWLKGERGLRAGLGWSCGDLLGSGETTLLLKDFLGGVLLPRSEAGDLRLSGDLTGDCLLSRVLSFSGDFLPRDSSFLMGLGVLPLLGDLGPPRIFLPGLLLREFSRRKLGLCGLLFGKSSPTPGLG